MKKLKEAMLQIPGGEIPITLLRSGETYRIEVDGVLWVKTTNVTHAVVLFTMMQEHICEYVHYQKREDSK